MNPSRLFVAPYEDAAVAALFSDAAWIKAMVRTETTLAQAQAKIGLIPPETAAAITARAETFSPDLARLHAATARDGFPIIELIAQLKTHVGPDAAKWIHWGATTQDVMDNALVAQISGAFQFIEQSLVRTTQALTTLAKQHRATLMVGRTHLQPALPITFGLQAAAWLAPLLRHRRRLAELRPRLQVLQCGGAAGTLASLGHQGPALARAWAAALGVGVPPMPWHAQRDSILETAHWLGLVGGSLAKFAQDVLLLTQAEIAELQESADGTGGGSSAMPQKRNPTSSETILVAVRSAAAHLTALQSSPPPELQRGTQTAQLELIHLPRLLALTGGALLASDRLAHQLVVYPARMQANLAATHGTLLAEAATLALSAHLDPTDARALVREACAAAVTEKRHLVDILRERVTAPVGWGELRNETHQLGSTDSFIDAVLAAAAVS